MCTKETEEISLQYYDMLYRQCRGIVEHEDHLVDQRLKWSITVSALLYTIIGGSFLAGSQVGAKISSEELSLIMMLFSLMGFRVCWSASESIHAAQTAIKKIDQDYQVILNNYKKDFVSKGILVFRLTGEESTRYSGFISSIVIPATLMWGWLNSMIYSLFLIVRQNFEFLNQKTVYMPIGACCILATFILFYSGVRNKQRLLMVVGKGFVGGSPIAQINEDIFAKRRVANEK